MTRSGIRVFFLHVSVAIKGDVIRPAPANGREADEASVWRPATARYLSGTTSCHSLAAALLRGARPERRKGKSGDGTSAATSSELGVDGPGCVTFPRGCLYVLGRNLSPFCAGCRRPGVVPVTHGTGAQARAALRHLWINGTEGEKQCRDYQPGALASAVFTARAESRLGPDDNASASEPAR